MASVWKCKTTRWSDYYTKIEYISDPSIDLIEQFKQKIVDYDEPKNHSDYVPCDNVERRKGHLLFILGSRVEIIIKPNNETHVLYFMSCEDI